MKSQEHSSGARTRIAVVSPFLDKQHGTERCLAEQIERLAADYEIHLYSTAVQDVDLSKIVWHHIPALPGPHLFAYSWWVLANHWRRWWDARFRKLAPMMVYSPGINCFDADVISVHILFEEFYRRTRNALRFRSNPVLSWPRLLHRRLYYRLMISLEHLVYSGKKAALTVVSAKVARNLRQYGCAESRLPVILHGIDASRFNLEARTQLRDFARRRLGLNEEDFCLLLLGNDWKNKGLDCVLEALGRLRLRSICLLVIGCDMVERYRRVVATLRLEDRVKFLPPRPDVEFYYAAADLYAGPSLEDAFGLPMLESMACGVPTIVSNEAGVSQIVSDGIDGFILDDPRDSARLADLIALLYRNPGLRQRIGEAGARTARQCTWDRNAELLGQVFRQVLYQKSGNNCASVPTEFPRRWAHEPRRRWQVDRRTGPETPGQSNPSCHDRTAYDSQAAVEYHRGSSESRRRIAIVSPFLDKRHGTERRVVELVERLARDHGHEVHIYSQQVRDVAGVEQFKILGTKRGESRLAREGKDGAPRLPGSGRLIWHSLPRIPGPHVFNYVWWLITNHIWRWWDRRLRGLGFDLVYSPGINCFDADVASVHVLFRDLHRQLRSALSLRANPLRAWPWVIHRRIYYRLMMILEALVYARPSLRLAAISRKTREALRRIRRCDDHVPVIYTGLDQLKFNAARRKELRPEARRGIGLSNDAFALLLIGNDWNNKGLECVLAAIGRLKNTGLRLLVVGQNSVQPYQNVVDQYGLGARLIFLPTRSDVEYYYAAADLYVCPSLDDAFALPPFEAMACGLPVIASSQAGVSELIADGVDGFILDNPRDSGKLAGLIAPLYLDEDLRERIGQAAAEKSRPYTWERNAERFETLFEEVLCEKRRGRALAGAQQTAR